MGQEVIFSFMVTFRVHTLVIDMSIRTTTTIEVYLDLIYSQISPVSLGRNLFSSLSDRYAWLPTYRIFNISVRSEYISQDQVPSKQKGTSYVNILSSRSYSSALQFSMRNTCKHPPSLPLIRQDRIISHRLSSFHQLLHLQARILMRIKYC